jgi:hypothetical protein
MGRWEVVFTKIVSTDSFGTLDSGEATIEPEGLVLSDPQTGYLITEETVTGRIDSITHRNSIIHHWYRTLDGGESWDTIDFDAFIAPPSNGWTFIPDGKPGIFTPSSHSVYVRSQPSNYLPLRPVLCSSDAGNSWHTIPWSDKSHGKIWHPFSDSEIVTYDSALHLFRRSNDFGATFPVFLGDSTVFGKYPAIENESAGLNSSNLEFACNTPNDWTMMEVAGSLSKLPYQHLRTFLTHTGGITWKEFVFRYFADTNATIHSTLQPITGTSHLYAFNHLEENRIGSLHSPSKLTFFYSSDYGESWTPNTSFDTRRFRGFEAADYGDIWMTLCPQAIPGAYDPAWLIVHSTDNGTTWSTDSLSLRGTFEVFDPYDGEIITSSGPTKLLAAWRLKGNPISTEVAVFKYRPPARVASGSIPPLPIFSFYPHPANERTTLRIPETLGIGTIDVYDLLGRKQLVSYEIKSSYLAELQTRTLSPGVYFAMVHYLGTYEPNGMWCVPLVVAR